MASEASHPSVFRISKFHRTIATVDAAQLKKKRLPYWHAGACGEKKSKASRGGGVFLDH